jgi:hypothetical protein
VCSVLPDPKILVGCDEFPARHRHGFDFFDSPIESVDSEINVATDSAATGCDRWLMVSARIARPVMPRQKKEFSADISRCTQNTRMLRCGSQSGGNGIDLAVWIADIGQQAVPQARCHPRVLRASANICAEILALRRSRQMVANIVKGQRRSKANRRNTTNAGALVWLQPAAALCTLSDEIPSRQPHPAPHPWPVSSVQPITRSPGQQRD